MIAVCQMPGNSLPNKNNNNIMKVKQNKTKIKYLIY